MMSFIHEIASKLIRDGWDNMRRYTLVFPMQRAGVYMRECLSKKMIQQGVTHPVVLPRMLTIDQLIDDLSPLAQADELQAICQLYTIYTEETGSDMALDAFYGWGRQLLQDFSNIESTKHNPQQVIANLASAQVLDQSMQDDEQIQHLRELLNLEGQLDSIRAYFINLWEYLPAIYSRFSAAQTAMHVSTRGGCLRYILDHWEETAERLDDHVFLFVGFNYLMPAELELIKRLTDRQQAQCIWDYDAHFHIDDDVYRFIRRNAEYLQTELIDPSEASDNPASAGSNKHITAIATSSANAQVQYAGQWLSEYAEKGKRTAVVITDESMLEPLIYTLPTHLEGVNITKGYPLKNTQIFSQTISWMNELAAKEPNLSPADALARLLALLESHRSEYTLSSALSASKTACLQAQWQDILQTEAYTQILLSIRQMQALLAKGVLAVVTTVRVLTNLLRRSLETISLPFHGEPIAEVQLIGVLETRLLDFDNLLIMNVEEGVVPGRSADFSFIPYDIRRAYTIQTREEEAKVYAYNFFRLLRRAENITLLFSEASDEMDKKSMSRFLMQLLLFGDYPITKKRITEPMSPMPMTPIVPNKRWSDTSRNGVLRLSPSAINTYVRCPRWFYLQYIEHISEAEQPSTLFENNDIGTLVHGTIQAAYELIRAQFHSDNITPKHILDFIDSDAAEANKQRALEKAYAMCQEDYNNRHKSNPIGEQVYAMERHEAENEVVKEMLTRVLQYDAKNLAPFTLLAMEEKCERTMELHDCKIILNGVMDRVDLIRENGQEIARILDYKAGSYTSDKLTAKNLETVFTSTLKDYVRQTLIYLWIAETNRQNLHIGNQPIRPELMFTQKLSADRRIRVANAVIDSIPEGFEDGLQNLLQQIYDDTAFEQCKETDCMSYCPFHLLCGREKKTFH